MGDCSSTAHLALIAGGMKNTWGVSLSEQCLLSDYKVIVLASTFHQHSSLIATPMFMHVANQSLNWRVHTPLCIHQGNG